MVIIKKLIYNSSLKKDIANKKKKINIVEEILKSIFIVIGVTCTIACFSIENIIPFSLGIMTVSIPIVKSCIDSKSKKIKKLRKASDSNLNKLVHELDENDVKVTQNDLINSKEVTSDKRIDLRVGEDSIKEEIIHTSDFYLKDIQNKLRILREEKKTIMESNNIKHESSLYLVNEEEIDYDMKRILKQDLFK